MVTKPRTNTRTRKTQEVAHIYDTFIVGAGISGLAAAIKLNEAGLTNFKIIEKQAALVVLGVKIPIRAVVVMYLRLCTLTRLLQVQNGAIICTSTGNLKLFRRC